MTQETPSQAVAAAMVNAAAQVALSMIPYIAMVFRAAGPDEDMTELSTAVDNLISSNDALHIQTQALLRGEETTTG